VGWPRFRVKPKKTNRAKYRFDMNEGEVSARVKPMRSRTRNRGPQKVWRKHNSKLEKGKSQGLEKTKRDQLRTGKPGGSDKERKGERMWSQGVPCDNGWGGKPKLEGEGTK